MAAWIWIVIAIAAVVLLAVFLFAGRNRRVVQQRKKAQELREEAATHHRTAKERENLAQEHAEHATAERKEGDKAAAQAVRVDPDRN